MAESFTNSLGRAVGVVTTATSGSIGIQTNKVTGISTTGIGVSAIVDNQHYIAGTKVLNFGTAAQEVVFDRDSTNTAAASSQTLKFLGVTTSYTSTVPRSFRSSYLSRGLDVFASLLIQPLKKHRLDDQTSYEYNELIILQTQSHHLLTFSIL